MGACFAPDDDGGVPFCVGSCPTQCVARCSDTEAGAPPFYYDFSASITGMCEDQCQIGNNWWCVGNEQYQYPAAISATRQLTVGFIDDIVQEPQVGVTVKLCNSHDPTCTMWLDSQVTNDGGVVTLTDPTGAGNGADFGLIGFLELSGPLLQQTTVYWGFPLSEPHGVIGTPIPVFTSMDWAGFLAVSQVTADPTRGHIAVVALDCLGYQAPGVTFTASGTDASTTLLYNRGGSVPSPDGATDQSGTAFFVNVPADQAVVVSAMPAGLGGQISGQQSVYIRAGWVTEVSVAPSPEMIQ